MKAIHLRTEYLKTPLGIDIVNPRFYWNCQGGERQTAYQIIARRGDEVVWDSGRVESDSMTHILYEGKALGSRERIYWQVRLWDENEAVGESAESWFEMGLLKAEDWRAKWITGNYRPVKNQRYPVDCFRRAFRAGKQVRNARLYVSACGLYEARLNGARVGDFMFAPGCTDYRKRIQYQTYDVTALLKKENALEIWLADGWYRGSVGCFGQTKVYGDRTKLICQLEIEYEDGRKQMIRSDEKFDWSNDGPIRFADLKDGEIYDASMTPSYDGHAAVIKERIVPSASDNVFPKKQETFDPVWVQTPSGERVLDFKQNIAGILRFTVRGEKGQSMKLFFGEILDEKGEFTQRNIHKHRKPVKEYGKAAEMFLMFGMEEKLRGELQPTPKQEIRFFCSGNEDTYEMRFAVFGFRYVKVDTQIPVRAADFQAIAVYSALEESGNFNCSHPLINRLVQNSRWSMKGNFLDVPMDCPTRERLGWLGEGQTFFETANYFMQAAPFYRKWLKDIADSQGKDGKPSAVVPYVGFDMLYGSNGSSVGWGDAVVLIPYRYWKRYQDVRILEECYESMNSYARFMIRNTGQKDRQAAKENPYNQYTYEKGVQLGEWLEPAEFQDTSNQAGARLSLQTEVCTAYLHYVMACMAEISQKLGKEKDYTLFHEYAEGAKKAYHWLYLQNGAPDTDRQAKLVRPLALGLADGEIREALQRRLLLAVENRNYRIGTGFLSTPFVLQVLSEAGYVEAAYRMLENEQVPGWLYEVKQDATTMWEDWEGSEFASFNHYAQGAVCQWLFEGIAGIRIIGENRFLIRPLPGGSLQHAGASWLSLYGPVRSAWERTEKGIRFRISIPANTSAEVHLPDGSVHEVRGEFNWEAAKT